MVRGISAASVTQAVSPTRLRLNKELAPTSEVGWRVVNVAFVSDRGMLLDRTEEIRARAGRKVVKSILIEVERRKGEEGSEY